MNPIVRRVAVVACSLFLLAACGGSDSEPDAASDDTTSATDADGSDDSEVDVPDGAIDLEDPAFREQFVAAFSQATGLSVDQADCVAQYFVDNDVDYDALIAAAGGAEPDAETARQVSEAVEVCA